MPCTVSHHWKRNYKNPHLHHAIEQGRSELKKHEPFQQVVEHLSQLLEQDTHILHCKVFAMRPSEQSLSALPHPKQSAKNDNIGVQYAHAACPRLIDRTKS